MKDIHVTTIALLLMILGWLVPGTTPFAHQPLDDSAHAEAHAADMLTEQVDIDQQVQTLVKQFRISGDDHLLDLAWERLHEQIDSPSVRPRTLIAAAFVAQARHRFSLAIDLVSRALEKQGKVDEAWLLLSSIHLVRGEYDAAAAACRGLTQAAPLVVVSCKARAARPGTAEQAQALVRLARVLDLELATRLPDEVLAWSYAVAGDLAVASNDRPTALRYYTKSLKLAESSQVRSALVDVQLEAGDYAAAKRSLMVESGALPLVIRRLIVARQSSWSDEDAATRNTLDKEFRHWIEHGDWLHAREMARFYLDVADDPTLARRLAQINVQEQREPEDLRLVRRTATLVDPRDAD